MLKILLLLISGCLSLLTAEMFLRWVVPWRYVHRHPEFVVESVHPEDDRIDMAEPLFGAGLRYVDAPWKYGLKRNLRSRFVSSEYDTEFSTNSRGLRGPEFEDPGKGKRILGVGDSFAMGYGVEQEETYLTLLGNELQGHGEPLETINAGVVGYTPGNSYQYLLNEGLALEPEYLVFQLWVGDDLCTGSGVGRPRPHGTLAQEKSWRYLARESHLAMLVRDRLRGHDAARGWLMGRGHLTPFNAPALLGRSFAEQCGGPLRQLRKMLVDLGTRSQSSGVKLVVLLIPLREQVYLADWRAALKYNGSSDDKAIDFESPGRAVAETLEGTGVALVDALDVLRSDNSDSRLYFKWDPHLTAAGHKLVAQQLARRFAALN